MNINMKHQYIVLHAGFSACTMEIYSICIKVGLQMESAYVQKYILVDQNVFKPQLLEKSC